MISKLAWFYNNPQKRLRYGCDAMSEALIALICRRSLKREEDLHLSYCICIDADHHSDGRLPRIN